VDKLECPVTTTSPFFIVTPHIGHVAIRFFPWCVLPSPSVMRRFRLGELPPAILLPVTIIVFIKGVPTSARFRVSKASAKDYRLSADHHPVSPLSCCRQSYYIECVGACGYRQFLDQYPAALNGDTANIKNKLDQQRDNIALQAALL
jgi:hypothetical protein